MTFVKDWSSGITFLVLLLFTCIVGLMANIFIAAVNFPDWLRGRKIKAYEKIQCVLALSRTCFLCISVTKLFIAISGKKLVALNNILFLMFISNTYANLWYFTLLSVLFFVEAGGYKHALFIRLKVLMTRRLMRFIVGVTLVSLCSASIRIWTRKLFSANAPPLKVRNETCGSRNVLSNLCIIALENSGPFIIYSVCSIMLVNSVCHHVKRMRSSDSGLSRSNLDSHYVAINSLAVSYLIFGLYIGFNIFGAVSFYCLGIFNSFLFLNISPNLHSVYLICRTPKLRQQFLKAMQQAANRVTKRGGAAFRETRKVTTIA